MKILITNDDGIRSPVLTALADALHQEHQVLVAAPATDQSGMSQAFTHGAEKRLAFKADAHSPYPKFEVYGTPCDCVKFAVAHLFKATEIDLVLSGINLGENAGMSAVYSGTVAAAREGAMWGIPSIAVSVWHNAPERLTHAVDWILRLLRKPSRLPQRPGGLWNVNFPPCAPSEIKGALVTRMSTVMFRDTYEAVRTEHGLTEFRLVGYKPQDEFVAGTDDWALAQGRISITPLKVSQSDGAEADRLAALGADWGVP